LKVHLLIGDSDEFVSVPDVEANMEKLRKLDVETDIFIYKGGHRVTADGLKHLSEI
jgi:predicted esterase